MPQQRLAGQHKPALYEAQVVARPPDCRADAMTQRRLRESIAVRAKQPGNGEIVRKNPLDGLESANLREHLSPHGVEHAVDREGLCERGIWDVRQQAIAVYEGGNHT